jgi:hypothetical protein
MSQIVQTISSQYVDGHIYCQIRQMINPSLSAGNQIQSLSRSVYILIATGPTSSTGIVLTRK